MPSAEMRAVRGDRLDAVIFDMDGVVTDTASTHCRAWKVVFDDYLRARATGRGEPFGEFTEEDYLQFVDGKPRYDGVRSFLSSRGIELPEGDRSDAPGTASVCALGNLKDEIFERSVREAGVVPFASTVRMLRALRSTGIKTALISSSRHARAIIGSAHVSDLFDVIVDGVDSASAGLAGKPDPAIFLEASRRLGVPPPRAAVVEDALAGVEAGHRGGFALVVGVNRTGQADALSAGGADVVVTDLDELDAPITSTP
jgi:beta-phosphoglucomutase family hydrolase